jgi:hypothetical protein
MNWQLVAFAAGLVILGVAVEFVPGAPPEVKATGIAIVVAAATALTSWLPKGGDK